MLVDSNSAVYSFIFIFLKFGLVWVNYTMIMCV